VVQLGLRYGMILFIVSQVMSFLAFFCVFFHSSLAPMVKIGAIWPPKGVDVLSLENSFSKYPYFYFHLELL
jgi:cytochrome c oxidase subunit 3